MSRCASTIPKAFGAESTQGWFCTGDNLILLGEIKGVPVVINRMFLGNLGFQDHMHYAMWYKSRGLTPWLPYPNHGDHFHAKINREQ